jgi:hypothetical protein
VITVPDAAARAAAELRAVLARPGHSEEYRRNMLAGAKVAVARAIADATLDPATKPGARRRFHATAPGFLARMEAYKSLPDTYPELLAVLDSLAGARPVAVAA